MVSCGRVVDFRLFDHDRISHQRLVPYVPDLPGCVATGATVEEVESNIRDAIRFHLDGLREDGIPIQDPTSICEYVEP